MTSALSVKPSATSPGVTETPTVPTAAKPKSTRRPRPLPSTWDGDIVSERFASAFTGLTLRTLQTHRYYKTGPKWYASHNRIGYRLSDLEAYMEHRNAPPILVEPKVPVRRPGRPSDVNTGRKFRAVAGVAVVAVDPIPAIVIPTRPEVLPAA
jgi:hypothetical protein